ncbi:hypothetical protein MWU75_15720 [Ornithinimicrobium sp. F0845]|uniref:hypothetical protein n=1 Tax=Ornithinimicrobium sp. F0845 TaxID=2926412 RepID=UPI001FF4333B|nr:hypothetical protein [Ornithinimicrobium sp. F0845]MCK0113594.1 hypothetical protein [Ornithinimicrobium sp. F0845]
MLVQPLRRPLAATFEHLADGLAGPPGEPEAETQRAWLEGVRHEVAVLLSRTGEQSVPAAQRALVSALAYAARDAAVRLDDARRLPLQ